MQDRKLDPDGCYTVVAGIQGEGKIMYEACLRCLREYRKNLSDIKVPTVEELVQKSVPLVK